MKRTIRFAAALIAVASVFWLIVAHRITRRPVRQTSVAQPTIAPRPRNAGTGGTDEWLNPRDIASPPNKASRSSFSKGGGKISRPVVDAFLEQHGRTPQTLLIAWHASGIDDYLAEAIAKFPDAPEVALAVLETELSDKERGDWIERFKRNAPDNPLANFYAAREYLRQNDVERATREITEAAGMSHFDDYYHAGWQAREALFLAAGWTAREARSEAVFGEGLLAWTGRLSELTKGLKAEQQAASSRGDAQGVVARAADAMVIARSLPQGGPAATLITQLFAISLERKALEELDATQGFKLLGEPVADRLAVLKTRREEIDKLSQFVPNTETGNVIEQELMDYLEVAGRDGEIAALRALAERQATRR